MHRNRRNAGRIVDIGFQVNDKRSGSEHDDCQDDRSEKGVLPEDDAEDEQHAEDADALKHDLDILVIAAAEFRELFRCDFSEIGHLCVVDLALIFLGEMFRNSAHKGCLQHLFHKAFLSY